jgi:predicted small lipoprotein YifL
MVSACGMQGDLYLPDEEPESSANKVSSKNTIQKT